ncbi:MAG: 30S ribosomal protein S12 methylthiotransferase RimO [Oscillospiraceae bacterium]|nr:30S ribosomal protein S12 methylthiotransferase RimO [Oscillospiraceae bacterium]
MNYKIGMVTLGCPKNQMDAEIMLASLKNAGMKLTEDSGLSDVVIINTCGFIEDAKRESIEQILEFAKLKDEGRIKKIIVTGCMAERYKSEIMKEMPECDAVIGLGANSDIVQVVKKVVSGQRVERFPDKSCWSLDGERIQTTPSFYAYLRIADGCNNCCSYCAIPMIRGRYRSRSIETLVEEARSLAINGVKELVLVAQDTTLYGIDIYGRPMLPELLKELCKIEQLRWIRLLYCYPEHITDELLNTIAQEPKIVKYMDIPIQHSSKKVLAAMNREGDDAALRQKIDKIRNTVKDIVLRTTIMVGFPAEGKAEFDELCLFLNDMKFERLGCFAFSSEEGTKAAKMPNGADEREKQRRRDIVMEMQTRILDDLNKKQTGKIIDVLVESYDRYAGCWFGRSAADAPDIDGKVFFTCPAGKVRAGDIIKVRIDGIVDWDLMGEYCE